MRHALGIPGPKGRTEVLPFAVYSIPEVAYIGETEESLIAEGDATTWPAAATTTRTPAARSSASPGGC